MKKSTKVYLELIKKLQEEKRLKFLGDRTELINLFNNDDYDSVFEKLKNKSTSEVFYLLDELHTEITKSILKVVHQEDGDTEEDNNTATRVYQHKDVFIRVHGDYGSWGIDERFQINKVIPVKKMIEVSEWQEVI
jgi:hypothetical protein